MKMGRIKLGMVGGGKGSFIGEVHRMAARLDGRYELLAGAFSADAKRAKESALDLGLLRPAATPLMKLWQKWKAHCRTVLRRSP